LQGALEEVFQEFEPSASPVSMMKMTQVTILRWSYCTGLTQLVPSLPTLPQYTVLYLTRVNYTLMVCHQDVIATSDTTTCSHLDHSKEWWDVLCVDNYELLACHALIVFPYSLTDSIFLLHFVVLFFTVIYLMKYIIYMIILLDVILNDKETMTGHTRTLKENSFNLKANQLNPLGAPPIGYVDQASWWHVPHTNNSTQWTIYY